MTYEGRWKEKLVCPRACACRGVDPMIFNKWSHTDVLLQTPAGHRHAAKHHNRQNSAGKGLKVCKLSRENGKVNFLQATSGRGREGGSLRSYIKSNEAAGRS